MGKDFDKVKCELCGKQFPVLATHVNRMHHLSGAEYLKQFPKAKLSSVAYIEKVRNSAKINFYKIRL